MRNLLIINVDQNNNETNKLTKNLSKNYLTVYLNNNIINPSLNYIILDDLVKPKHYVNVNKKARSFKKTWFKPIESELTYFDISLGELVETLFLKLWPTFLKIDILSELIKNLSSIPR